MNRSGTFRRGGWLVLVALLVNGSVIDSLAAADEPAPPEFDNQILPILTKAGCNTGACHGAAIGRGGFQLSLYGQDPELDWERIVRHFGGRRINLVDAEMSLLVRKAGEFIEHGGGQPLDPDSKDWQTLVDWIRSGAPRSASAPALRAIRTEPSQISVAPAATSEVAFRVFGALEEGSQLDLPRQRGQTEWRDLTEWAVLTSLDPQSLALGDSPGTVRPLRPGRHVLLVRVRDKTTAVEILCPYPAPAPASRPEKSRRCQQTGNSLAKRFPMLPRPRRAANSGGEGWGEGPSFLTEPTPHDSGTGLIDRLINQRLAELGIPAAPLADDASFLRRVTLDLTGRLPSVEEVQRFARDRSPHKRLRKIDSLLASPAATDYWTHRIGVALRIDALGGRGGYWDAASHYQDFLRAQWTAATPLPELLAGLISASGTPEQNGAVGFYLSASDARAQTELFSEVVLGVRMRCANCHDHPLDRWTQEDYHGLAALFAGVRRGDEVAWFPGASNINPATGDPEFPRLPDGTEVSATSDPRPRLADFVRGSGASWVARAWVNRLWAELFGRGLVDPVDDLRGSNPATHPALLDALAADWQRHDLDLRYLIREIARSDAYGRAASPQTAARQRQDAESIQEPESLQGAEFYAYRTPRPLSAAVVLDAIADVTSLAGEQESGPTNPRAILRLSLGSPATPNAEPCGSGTACPDDLSDSLSGRLATIAGPLVNGAIADPQGVVQHWANDPSLEPSDVIEQLYLRCLSRLPQSHERQYWLAQLGGTPDAEAPRATGSAEADPVKASSLQPGSLEFRHALEDMAWSLLTSHSFITNQ